MLSRDHHRARYSSTLHMDFYQPPLAIARGEAGPLRGQRAHLVRAVHAADELWLPGIVDVAALAQHREHTDVGTLARWEDRGLGLRSLWSSGDSR